MLLFLHVDDFIYMIISETEFVPVPKQKILELASIS